MGNESMNKQPDSLSEEEFELVLQYRARQARRASPARRFARSLSLLATSVTVVIVAVAWFQAVELQNNGYSDDIPAPLSWIAAIKINAKN